MILTRGAGRSAVPPLTWVFPLARMRNQVMGKPSWQTVWWVQPVSPGLLCLMFRQVGMTLAIPPRWMHRLGRLETTKLFRQLPQQVRPGNRRARAGTLPLSASMLASGRLTATLPPGRRPQVRLRNPPTASPEPWLMRKEISPASMWSARPASPRMPHVSRTQAIFPPPAAPPRRGRPQRMQRPASRRRMTIAVSRPASTLFRLLARTNPAV